MIRLEQALCLRAMGQPGQAVALAREVVAAFDAHHCVLQAARARLVLADCLLDTGDVDKAASLYRSALETLHDIPSLAWQAHAGLGHVAASRGEERAAYDHLVAAIHNIEIAVERLGLDELQAGFMSDKIDVYKQAVQLALRLGERDGAFGHVERSKSGVWRDFLSQGQAEAGDQDEIQTLRQQWHWLYTRLTRPDEEGDLRGGETQARWAELRALERQIAQARRETLQHLQTRPRLTPADIQQHVPPDVLLVDYYCTTSQVIAFVIARDDIRVCEPIASLAAVARLVNRWQFHLSSIRMLPVSQLLDEALEILHDLYGLLVSPLEPYVGTHSTLWVVPHDLIWAIPFAALHDGSQYLIDRLTIAYIPGLIPPGKPASDVASAVDHPLVVGYSEGGRLVHAIREAERVSETLMNAETLLESEATMDRVRTAASTCSLLHLATHGVFRTDAPLFSSIHLADGWLTAGDLEGWSLPLAELVTLSACETGMSLRRGGDLLGLARSLFRAGARRVLASQWAAHDASTAALMPHFYRELGDGKGASVALRGAQIATRDEHGHPFYWAGFQTMQLL
jgi:CHAT domain-containing protein